MEGFNKGPCLLLIVLMVVPFASSECLLDDFSDTDVSAVRRLLAEERSRRLVLQNDVEYLTLKLEELGKTSTGNSERSPSSVRQVAFEAHSHKDWDVSTTEYTAVTFGHVVLNLGQGYDAETGIFTAPLSGVYSFQAVLGVKPNKPGSFLVIRKGATVLSYTWSFEPAIWNQQTSSTVTHLTEGETIRVYVIGNMAGSDANHIHSSFSGYLIAAD